MMGKIIYILDIVCRILAAKANIRPPHTLLSRTGLRFRLSLFGILLPLCLTVQLSLYGFPAAMNPLTYMRDLPSEIAEGKPHHNRASKLPLTNRDCQTETDQLMQSFHAIWSFPVISQ
jgi:hypothetical protein